MARFLAIAEGRADSIATRTGSENFPARAGAGTWRVRALAEAYCPDRGRTPADAHDRLSLGLVRLVDSGGKALGGVQPHGQPMCLIDLSETQADALLGLDGETRHAIRQAIRVVLNSALPHALRSAPEAA